MPTTGTSKRLRWKRAMSPSARVVSGTRITFPGTRERSASLAASAKPAPARNACPMKAWASCFLPRIGTNSEPGSIVRLSVVTAGIHGSPRTGPAASPPVARRMSE